MSLEEQSKTHRLSSEELAQKASLEKITKAIFDSMALGFVVVVIASNGRLFLLLLVLLMLLRFMDGWVEIVTCKKSFECNDE